MRRLLLIIIVTFLYTSCSCGGVKQNLHNRKDRSVASTNVCAQQIAEEKKEPRKVNVDNLEIPVCKESLCSQILVRNGYILSYNKDTRNCNWVAYELTRSEAYGTVPRDPNFYEDIEVGNPRATADDYKGSGWSRGHMAPAADMKWSSSAMSQSCLYTNICPQDAKLNGGAWESVERRCRSLAKTYGSVYIVCGPLYSDNVRRIGGNDVCVPDFFFKVVLVPTQDTYSCIGFIFPNEPISADMKQDYVVSVDEVERTMGMDFFSKLPNSIENDIEARISWELLN